MTGRKKHNAENNGDDKSSHFSWFCFYNKMRCCAVAGYLTLKCATRLHQKLQAVNSTCFFYLRSMTEKILILDFGSQYTQLIARAVREANVYCEIIPYHKSFDFDPGLKGIILSGSPF